MKPEKKSKIVKKGNIYSCVQHSIPKIKEQTKNKKKELILENFQYHWKFSKTHFYNNSRIQTISAKTKYNDGPTRPEQTWPYFAI